MKRLLHFSLPQAVFSTQPLQFKEVLGGFEVEMMIFSTAFNRNKAYFQVSDLMKWQNKLDSILFDLNHDLSLSGGKYLGNQNKFTSLRADYSSGELEIFATFKTTDPLVVARKNEITAPSIELMVDEEDCISDEKGEYYTQFDWVGCALLLGIVAGSGNARVGEIKEFNFLQHYNLTQDMTKEEVQALLDAQAETLTATFKAENLAILKKFQELVETITTLEPAIEPVAETVEPTEPEPTPEEVEDQEILAQVQASLKTAEKREELLKQFKDSKLVDNRDLSDVFKVVRSQELPSFYKKLNN
jgi:Zn-dependent metalloprotease